MSSGGKDGDSRALEIFALRDYVIDQYKRFATSFTTIHAPDIRSQVEAIYAEQLWWPEPLIQINPSYKRTTDIGSLTNSGDLHPLCRGIFQTKGTPPTSDKLPEQMVAPAAALWAHRSVGPEGDGDSK